MSGDFSITASPGKPDSEQDWAVDEPPRAPADKRTVSPAATVLSVAFAIVVDDATDVAGVVHRSPTREAAI
jgi:hypothetical protein